jgi:hypothetical protein
MEVLAPLYTECEYIQSVYKAQISILSTVSYKKLNPFFVVSW